MKKLIVTLLLASLIPSLHAQWQEIETPQIVSVDYLNSVDGNLFLCGNNSIYKFITSVSL